MIEADRLQVEHALWLEAGQLRVERLVLIEVDRFQIRGIVRVEFSGGFGSRSGLEADRLRLGGFSRLAPPRLPVSGVRSSFDCEVEVGGLTEQVAVQIDFARFVELDGLQVRVGYLPQFGRLGLDSQLGLDGRLGLDVRLDARGSFVLERLQLELGGVGELDLLLFQVGVLPHSDRLESRLAVGLDLSRSSQAQADGDAVLTDLVLERDAVLAQLVAHPLEEVDRLGVGDLLAQQAHDGVLRALAVLLGELVAAHVADVVPDFGAQLFVHELAVAPGSSLLNNQDELAGQLIDGGCVDRGGLGHRHQPASSSLSALQSTSTAWPTSGRSRRRTPAAFSISERER